MEAKNSLLYSALTILLLIPGGVHAEVFLNEVMYDLEGSDADREWIEVYNSGPNAVDLSEWRLFEGNTNHTLSVSLGNALLPPQNYAIIADDAATFLNEHSGFSGTVFDSSFSLNNTGEILTLRDAELNDINSITYTSEWGATGDGATLQRSSNTWVAAAPTPGSAYQTTETPPLPQDESDTTTDESADSSESSSTSGSSGTTSTSESTQPEFITVSAGANRTVMVGAAEFFEAQAYKKDGTVHPYVTFHWNFGNGVEREGKKVLHQYNYPGTYVMWVAGVTADKLAATDKVTITVKPVNLVISAVTSSFIELTNNSKQELNLSLWGLRSSGNFFLFPQNTILAPGASAVFSNTVTGLRTAGAYDIALLYPNGRVATSYNQNQPTQTQIQTSQVSQSSTPSSLSSSSTSDSNATSTKDGLKITETEVVEETGNTPKALVASAALASPTNTSPFLGGNNLILWLSALLGLLLLSVLAVLFSSRKKEATAPNQLSADDFTIEEVKEN